MDMNKEYCTFTTIFISMLHLLLMSYEENANSGLPDKWPLCVFARACACVRVSIMEWNLKFSQFTKYFIITF